MSPQIPETASATQAEDITRSEQIMIFFLSCWSISTPMNIPSTAWGRNPASVAKERTAADFVFPVIYHMIAICTMELVRVDMPWPVQITKNFFLHPASCCSMVFSAASSAALSLSTLRCHMFSPRHMFSLRRIFSLRHISSILRNSYPLTLKYLLQPEGVLQRILPAIPFHVHASLRRYKDLFLLQKHSLQVRMFK